MDVGPSHGFERQLSDVAKRVELESSHEDRHVSVPRQDIDANGTGGNWYPEQRRDVYAVLGRKQSLFFKRINGVVKCEPRSDKHMRWTRIGEGAVQKHVIEARL